MVDNKPKPLKPNPGRFKPGNKAAVKANRKYDHYDGVGHPKSLKGQVKDALKLAEDAMPDIIASMIERATGRDPFCDVKTEQAASEYLIDRIYGKANQPLSSNSPWEILITYGKPAEESESPDEKPE